MNKFNHSNILFYIIKIIAISLTSIYFILLGSSFSLYIKNHITKYDEDIYFNKSKFKIFIEVSIIISLLGISHYIIRNIVERIPFPFEGIGGFQYKMLKEIGGGIILSYVLYVFHPDLHKKIKHLFDREKNIF
jgi:hypothetical protein